MKTKNLGLAAIALASSIYASNAYAQDTTNPTDPSNILNPTNPASPLNPMNPLNDDDYQKKNKSKIIQNQNLETKVKKSDVVLTTIGIITGFSLLGYGLYKYLGYEKKDY